MSASRIAAEGERKIFRMDKATFTDFLGKKYVQLPLRQGITTIVVNLDRTNARGVERLLINHNPVTTIEGTEKLVGVKCVNCLNCGLDAVPQWIKVLPAVESVSFGLNNIKELPLWLLQMKTLKRVHIYNNKG